MADVLHMLANSRQSTGKGAARAARREGQIPGVIYGAGKDPVHVTITEKILMKELHGPFYSSLYDIEIEGANKERVLPRDVQFHPVTDRPEHVDFLRVSARTKVTVNVPILIVNEEQSPGLEEGGVLNVVRHEVELACRADAIPNEIEIDLTGKAIGDSVHISEVSLPDGVEPTITDRDFTIVTVAAPTIYTEPEPEEEEELEGEESEEGVEGEESEEGAEGGESEGGEEDAKEE